jgi:hypothetical protein
MTEVISLYTSEQAVEDGIKIRLNDRLRRTTNCPRYPLAPHLYRYVGLRIENWKAFP